MSAFDSAIAYQQSSGFTATAVGQVVALYDRIVRDLRQAILAVEAGQIEKKVNALNHALTIVGELQGVLDFERGGTAARNLNSFYNIVRPMMMKAGAENTAETLQELVAMFTRLRTAWARIEPSVGAHEPAQQPRISSTSPRTQGTSNASGAEAEPIRGSGWNA